jgi:hypothetical protein
MGIDKGSPTGIYTYGIATPGLNAQYNKNEIYFIAKKLACT